MILIVSLAISVLVGLLVVTWLNATFGLSLWIGYPIAFVISIATFCLIAFMAKLVHDTLKKRL